MCLTMEAHGIKTVVLLEMLFLIFIKGRHICFVIFGTRDNTVMLIFCIFGVLSFITMAQIYKLTINFST